MFSSPLHGEAGLNTISSFGELQEKRGMEFPRHYLITPTVDDEPRFLAGLERSLQAGTRLLQLKGKGMDPEVYAALATQVVERVHGHGGKILLTGDPSLVQSLGADGLHLDSEALRSASARPIPEQYLLAVSGHTLEDLQKGEALGANLAVLSPIKYTKAHPDIEPLRWDGLKRAAAELTIPVYALGGVGADDEPEALESGAQGVAGSRGYWKA